MKVWDIIAWINGYRKRWKITEIIYERRLRQPVSRFCPGCCTLCHLKNWKGEFIEFQILVVYRLDCYESKECFFYTFYSVESFRITSRLLFNYNLNLFHCNNSKIKFNSNYFLQIALYVNYSNSCYNIIMS